MDLLRVLLFLWPLTLTLIFFDYVIFCHQSEEKGHKMMLKYMNVEPLISLNMRLGEGTGCAVAYPVIQSAVKNILSSFLSINRNIFYYNISFSLNFPY
ncbi:Nicotinate-nucleotide--dimethylbenzimidazole phosphoribosyltransferase [subsurface metagenome]